MCAGHHHFDHIELKEICNRFQDYFSDILDLQSKAPNFQTERYINNLTALVIFSDTLSNEQKHTFFRKSYDQALEAGEKGDEWKSLLGLLVGRTDALTLAELRDIMSNTTHEPLKLIIEKAIDRIEERSKVITPDSKQESEMPVQKSSVEENLNDSDNNHDIRLWIILGVVFSIMAVFLLRKFRHIRIG